MKKLVIISDTHRQCPMDLPKGDILIHAGDFDIRDEWELNHVINWFMNLDYKHIIWIAGNHDLYMGKLFKAGIKPDMLYNLHYLCNSSVEIEGIKFWGSPYSPVFGQGWAFNGFSDYLKKLWNTIPEDSDIIVSHCNPFGINDVVRGISQGCPTLRDRIKEIKPKLHASGHIHEGHGVYKDEHTIYVNGSIMDEFYEPVNKPIVIDYEN